MRKLIVLLTLVLPLSAQNVRFSTSFPSISTQSGTPFLVANVPPNSPIINWCNAPAILNGSGMCVNFATTFNSVGAACPNGSQDTPDPQPSVCQTTGDAQGNIGVFAPAGTYDYTVQVGSNVFGPYRVTLVSSGGGGGGVTGSGTAGVMPVWSGPTTLANGDILDNQGGSGVFQFNLPEIDFPNAMLIDVLPNGGLGGNMSFHGSQGGGVSGATSCGGNIILSSGASQSGIAGGSVQITGSCNGTTGNGLIRLQPGTGGTNAHADVIIGPGGTTTTGYIFSPATTTFANLATPSAGVGIIFCSDCTSVSVGAACAGSGAGKMAMFYASSWRCY
jgi:hypothetical protein